MPYVGWPPAQTHTSIGSHNNHNASPARAASTQTPHRCVQPSHKQTVPVIISHLLLSHSPSACHTTHRASAPRSCCHFFKIQARLGSALGFRVFRQQVALNAPPTHLHVLALASAHLSLQSSPVLPGSRLPSISDFFDRQANTTGAQLRGSRVAGGWQFHWWRCHITVSRAHDAAGRIRLPAAAHGLLLPHNSRLDRQRMPLPAKKRPGGLGKPLLTAPTRDPSLFPPSQPLWAPVEAWPSLSTHPAALGSITAPHGPPDPVETRS